MSEIERKVICDACGDVVEMEAIPAGEDDHDRIIDGYEHGCVKDGDERASTRSVSYVP